MLRSKIAMGGLLAVAMAVATAGHAQAPSPDTSRAGQRFELAQACGWYAIFQCGKNANLGGPGYVIVTNDFPNFRPGWYCKVLGPYGTQGEAAYVARQGGGYAKSAC